MRWMTLAVALMAVPAAPAADASVAADEARLQKANLKTDGESLLQFFRERTVRADQKEIRSLVAQLGARSFATRKKASAGLIALGARAVPSLREALKHEELEVRRRAEECLDEILRNSQPDLLAAAGRLLAVRRPAGAAEALLDVLPSVVEDDTVRELHGALARLTLRDGKPEPAVIKALADEDPSRRAAAAAALCRAGVKEQHGKVKALLRDPDATVRLHAGLALLALGDKDTVPVLIGLFDTLSLNQLWQAEDALYRLAQDKAPAVALGDTAETKAAFRNAWLGWWKANGDKVDPVALLKDVRRDYTLVVLLDESEVLELDSKDKERFRLTKIAFPLDAQTLPGDRVLLAEHGGGRVTERLRDGTVLWEKLAPETLAAQRLDNGRTFIATKDSVMEVDREGKVLFSWSPPNGDQVMRAKKLPDGTVAMILHNAQRYVVIDSTGKEVGGFPFSVNVSTFGGRVDVQADGSVLIPQMYLNKVVEYDAKGKVKGEFSVGQPIVATRLANGNTIVTSMNENRAVELDPAGKTVWEYKTNKPNSRVTRAYRR